MKTKRLLMVMMAAMILFMVSCKQNGKNEAKEETNDSAGDVKTEKVSLWPVEIRGKYGYINVAGEIVITPQFNFAKDFHEGLAAVRAVDRETLKWGYIDKTGKIVIEAQFDEAYDFHEGLARVEKKDKWCYIDKTGKIVWQEQDRWEEEAVEITKEEEPWGVYNPPANVEEEEDVEDEVFLVVEEMPEFPGGMTKLAEYLSTNIKYPPMAREAGIQGKVFVGFVVEPDGTVSNVNVLSSVPGLDEEAVRVVKSMPKWKPGKQRGETVRVRYQVPINFQLK